MTANFAKSLNLVIRPCAFAIGAIDDLTTKASGALDCTFFSMDGKYEKKLTFIIIPQISWPVPLSRFPSERIKIPEHMSLADPDFHLPRAPDVLIGSGASLALFSCGRLDFSMPEVDLIFQETRLGWAVASSVNKGADTSTVFCSVTELKKLLERFWVIHDQEFSKPHQAVAGECKAHFQQNVARDESGRYIVRLPFRVPNPNLGDSRAAALKRFHGLRRKLDKNPALAASYEEVMNEYFRLGHATEITAESTPGYYLPHRAVVKKTSTTTKTRVVFDASARTDRGISLNSALLTGPVIQDKLFSHLIRFRLRRYVITADIAQMYRQVWIHPDDRCFLRVFWTKGGQLRVYQLNTVTV